MFIEFVLRSRKERTFESNRALGHLSFIRPSRNTELRHEHTVRAEASVSINVTFGGQS